MNKTLFWCGLFMLFFPFILFGTYLLILELIALQINWFLILIGISVLSYVGIALYLIAKGASEQND